MFVNVLENTNKNIAFCYLHSTVENLGWVISKPTCTHFKKKITSDKRSTISSAYL